MSLPPVPICANRDRHMSANHLRLGCVPGRVGTIGAQRFTRRRPAPTVASCTARPRPCTTRDSVLSPGSFGRRSLHVAGSHLPPELDHLFLKVDHSLGAHGCQSNEFHDYGPYPAMAGEGFVELREPVVEFP